jgi:hypothetical protein
MSRGRHHPAPRVLAPMSLMLLSAGDGTELEHAHIACPACISPGAEGGDVDGLAAASGACLWLIRWMDGAEVAVCLPAGEVPGFVELRRAVEQLLTVRLELMPPANLLPA